jgi:hypothetical protein
VFVSLSERWHISVPAILLPEKARQ